MSDVVVTPEQTYRHLLRRYERDGAKILAARAEGVAHARATVPAIARELGCRVYLFGSFAWGDPHPESDFDLAVEGLPSVLRDTFGSRAMIALHAPVDVVRLEEITESFRKRILSEGVLLDAEP